MKTNKKKILVPLLVLALVVTTIGGTLAWLMDKTDTITNTFTVGNVGVTLQESEGEAVDYNFHMVPGNTIQKDPMAALTTDSEDAYLFVKVDKSANFDEFLTATIDGRWTRVQGTEGTGIEGVYYITNPTKGEQQSILAGDIVKVKGSVTNEMMKALTEKNYPKLTFMAYAVQKDNLTVEQAWKVAQGVDPSAK